MVCLWTRTRQQPYENDLFHNVIISTKRDRNEHKFPFFYFDVDQI